MAGVNFIGSYSGIDRSMIDKLMEAEKLPLVQLSNKKSTLTQKQNAWRDINTRLNSLFEKIKALQNQDTFMSKTAKSTNDQIVTISPSKNAIEGAYKINVKQLATYTSFISGKVSAAYDKDGNLDINQSLGLEDGFNFTITNSDGIKAEIEVDSNDSLKSIVNKVNEKSKDVTIDGKTTKGTGISATIIDGKIVLSDAKTGSRNIILEGSGNGTLTKLGLNATSRHETKGQDAEFTVNGVKITRSSNSISDAIEGVRINLHKEHKDGEYDNVTVSLDTEKATKAIQDFVDQYNSTMKFIEEKLAAGDPEVPGSAGTLSGDGTLMRLHSSLRNMVTSSLGNKNTNIKDISQLGVTTIDKFGQLKFDSSKLKEALSDDIQNVINFFYSKNEKEEDIGFVSRINTYIDSFISKSEGIIKTKTEGYDKTLKDINKQIETFNARMERKEKYYIKMFTALDVAMMQAEGQMNWLQGQIDAMNSTSFKKK